MRVYVVLTVLFGACHGGILPESVLGAPCYRGTPEYDGCLLDKLRHVFPKLARGSLSARIPALEPLSIPYLAAEGATDGVSVKLVMKNTTVTGHADADFQHLHFDPETMTAEVAFVVPAMRMTTRYSATGLLFVIPLESHSYFDGNFTGLDMSLRFTLERTERKGVEYLQINKMAFKGRVETAKVKITAIDSENELIVNALQDFFNDNDRLVLDTINPFYKRYAAEFYMDLLNNILKYIPADELIPK